MIEPPPEGDHGIKEPEKEPTKAKRNVGPELETEMDDVVVLERESSGLRHLRRRSLEKDLRRLSLSSTLN